MADLFWSNMSQELRKKFTHLKFHPDKGRLHDFFAELITSIERIEEKLEDKASTLKGSKPE